MHDPRPVAPDDGHDRGADAHDEIQPGPATRHRVGGALEPDQGARRHRGERRGFRRERRRSESELGLLLGEALPDRVAGRITPRVESRIHLRQHHLIDGCERRTDGNRDEHLLAHGLAARLDAPLVVALAGPAEAGLHQIMRSERGEPQCQRARTTDQDPHDSGAQIVIRDAGRRPLEVSKRADVPIEKADLILALVDPREIAAEYISRIRNSHAFRRVPSTSTSTSKKSTSAR